MKKIIIVALVALVFTSCDMVTDSIYTDKAKGHSLYYSEEWEGLDSYAKIGRWMHDNISYRADDYMDEWADPAATVSRGYGDCEDYAILFMNIAYYSMEIEMELVLVDQAKVDYSVEQPMRSIENGGIVSHALVRYNGVLVEPQNGLVVEGPVGYYYSFWQVF